MLNNAIERLVDSTVIVHTTVHLTILCIFLNLNAAADEKKPAWDVMAPPGPTADVTIDVDQGTWMSVDVRPDGKQLVFDLLGDLYTLPIGGGQATAVTTGVAWDMQPRYSPDGKRLVFTSDRGGGDNIWTVALDGSKPKQVTKESFRLINSPAWSPDGRFIAARKHFTSRRSLGAGEIWLYHADGGGGLQLTKRSNDQKDVGEPAFSPDGKHVYFSQDATPGDHFEYNKDPNGEIYAIKRLALGSGRIERFVFGAGGAVRPTPSPDGKRLAFVRRVRLKTVLFVHDTASGKERAVYDGLDRDMQEAWAIHGVYPAMAWMPDGKHIVLWAGGKLRRVNVATGADTVIEFKVKGTRRVMKALRYPVDVAPKEFAVSALRGVRTSPDGKRVVYQALGYLYARDLPDGTPRRLTKQTDHFESMPAFSRDGRLVAYATWNDDSLGTIRVVRASGGKGRVITQQPGHYGEPVFSPDGARVLYRKAVGGHLVSRDWSKEPGIYAVPAKGGAARRITRDGRRPHFGPDRDRVYLTDDGPGGVRLLTSVGLHGQELRVHLRSKNAVGFQLAPDGRYVAFSETSHVYVMPFIPTGRPVDVGPKFEGVPTTKMSTAAAFSLHWSADSKAVYWTRGGTLLERGLTEKKPTEHAIGFMAPTDRPSGVVAIKGARIITMKGDQVIERGTVVIDKDRISAVGADVAIPGDAHIIDGKGLTVMPGLIDVHAHFGSAKNGMTPQRNWSLYACLAFGVTTLHDPSHDTLSVFSASELQRAGGITGPRIFSTGTILYGAAGTIRAEVDSVADARGHLQRQKSVGAFSVKSYNQPRRDQRQQVIAAARQLRMMVVPEGGSLLQHNLTMLVDGHTGIEHSIPVAGAYDDVLQLWAGTDVGYTPTLVVAYGGQMGERYWYSKTDVWSHPRLTRFVPRNVLDPRARRITKTDDGDYNHVAVARFAKRLIDAGGKVQIGGHGQREGLGTHWEMWLLAQGGATALEVIRAGTLHGARYLGLDKDLGSIERGKLADLAILSANPLDDIRNSEKVKWVVVGGRVYDAATMNEAGATPKKRGPFFWER